MSHTKSSAEELINNQEQLLTREEILESTGYELRFYFPELPDNEAHMSSYARELQRTSVEFGAENVIGGLVLTEGYFGNRCQAIFVQQNASRKSSAS